MIGAETYLQRRAVSKKYVKYSLRIFAHQQLKGHIGGAEWTRCDWLGGALRSHQERRRSARGLCPTASGGRRGSGDDRAAKRISRLDRGRGGARKRGNRFDERGVNLKVFGRNRLQRDGRRRHTRVERSVCGRIRTLPIGARLGVLVLGLESLPESRAKIANRRKKSNKKRNLRIKTLDESGVRVVNGPIQTCTAIQNMIFSADTSCCEKSTKSEVPNGVVSACSSELGADWASRAWPSDVGCARPRRCFPTGFESAAATRGRPPTPRYLTTLSMRTGCCREDSLSSSSFRVVVRPGTQ
jgi:hypothetical protein